MDITRIFEEEGVIKRENYAESLYSVDAEGEPDDDQERTVSEMLVSGLAVLPIFESSLTIYQMDTNDIRSITPVMITKASNQVRQTTDILSTILLTPLQQHITPYPPPSLEHPDMSSPVLALGSLFTPPPSDQFDPPSPLTPSPPARKRYCLSYVAVPPFPEGRTRSDYIRVPQRKRVRAELHQTLGEALQASLDHNSRLNDLYTIRRDKEGSHLSKKKRQRHTQRNVVAGPSSTSVPRENFKVNRKRDREESHGDDIPRKKTKTHQNAERKHHTHEDLLSNRRSIYSRPRAHVMYEDGCLRLSVGSIPPVQVAVLNLNARFVLAATHAKEYGREKKENLAKSSREVEENRHGPKKSWFAWPPSRPSFLDAAREEYIAGGPVRQGTDAGSGEVTGEVLLDYMGARELSPEHSPRTKEREKRPLKRSIRAIEPLSNVIQPTPRPREPNASTSREPRPQLHQFRKEIPGFPSPSHRPRSQETRVVREASSARHDHGGEGKVLRKSTAQVIQETSPERHETSRERQPSASDRHHSRKPTSEVGQEPSPEQREASQENRIHPHKPDRATEETPSERYEAGQEGIVTPSDPPRPHKPSRATEEMPSERYEASQEGIVTPSDPPRPHKPSRRLGPKTPSGRREAGHEMVLPSPTRKPSITMNVVQETSSEHHGASQEGMLSAKALGKRRAVSPFDARFGTDPPSPAPQLTVNQDELQTTSQQDLYVPTLSKGFASLSTDFFAPSTQLGTAPFMPQVPFSDPDNFLDCTLDSTSKTYDFDQPQIDDDELFLPQSITTHLGSLPTSPQFDEAMANPWLASSNASSISNPSPSAVYGDGTIDPSLLGGTQDVDLLHFTLPASPTLPYPPYPSAQSPSPWDKISPFRRSTSDSTRSPTPSTSSVSSVSPPSNPSSRSLFALVSRHSSPASEYVESKSVTTVPLRPPRPSRHSVRHVPADMVPTSEINVSSSEEDEPITRPMKRAKKSSAVPKQKLQSDSASDLESGRTKPKPKPKPKANSKWPLCDRHEFCHQCRSTTYKAKLRCPCGKKYCVRCLSTRYVVNDTCVSLVSDIACPNWLDIQESSSMILLAPPLPVHPVKTTVLAISAPGEEAKFMSVCGPTLSANRDRCRAPILSFVRNG